MTLLPIQGDGEIIADAVSLLLARSASLGRKKPTPMDALSPIAAVAVVAAIDRYYNGKATAAEAARRIANALHEV